MTLREASTRFLEHFNPQNARDQNQEHARAQTLGFLTSYLPEAALAELTPARLRDFIARWYIEETDHQPEPQALLESLADFFSWIDATGDSAEHQGCHTVIAELKASLPRAVEISNILSSQLRARGAFGFPEFLTSFEGGGRSQYDVDVGGSVAALEGFFRICRIDGARVEAEELISGERVWPVTFPANALAVQDLGYIINLELVRVSEGWHIATCGFAYPPGTEF